MDFTEQCTNASATLLELSTRVDSLEIQLLQLDERRNDTTLLTGIVTRLFEAKDLSDDFLHAQVPAISLEEPAVALAMRIAHQELMKRYWAIRDDLEVMTKVRDRRAPTCGKVVQFPELRTSQPPASVARASSKATQR